MTSRNAIVFAASAAILIGSACGEQKAGSGTSSAATNKSSAAPSASTAKKAEAPKGDVFFLQPTNGATVFPELDMAFGVKDIEIAAAGKGDDNKKGYIVVVVDGEPVPEGKPIPKDDKHLSFAKGEKNGTVKLEKGKHKLTVQFVSADGTSWGKKLSQTIEVEVLEDQGERSVSFLEPEDGAKVKNPVKMKFDVKGMKIELAGKDPNARTSGHHHVLIGHDPIPVGIVIPDNKTHKHFGKGQTEAELELPKGKQKITLQFADGSHNSYGPKMAQTITVEVE